MEKYFNEISKLEINFFNKNIFIDKYKFENNLIISRQRIYKFINEKFFEEKFLFFLARKNTKEFFDYDIQRFF